MITRIFIKHLLLERAINILFSGIARNFNVNSPHGEYVHESNRHKLVNGTAITIELLGSWWPSVNQQHPALHYGAVVFGTVNTKDDHEAMRDSYMDVDVMLNGTHYTFGVHAIDGVYI
jgi:hypothetical protein